MRWMFQNAKKFNQPIGDWRVDQVTDMRYMFNGASSFDQPIGDWRVDQVTDMEGMFNEASAFDQPRITLASHFEPAPPRTAGVVPGLRRRPVPLVLLTPVGAAYMHVFTALSPAAY